MQPGTRDISDTRPRTQPLLRVKALTQQLSAGVPGAGMHVRTFNPTTFAVWPGELVVLTGQSRAALKAMLDVLHGDRRGVSGVYSLAAHACMQRATVAPETARAFMTAWMHDPAALITPALSTASRHSPESGFAAQRSSPWQRDARIASASAPHVSPRAPAHTRQHATHRRPIRAAEALAPLSARDDVPPSRERRPVQLSDAVVAENIMPRTSRIAEPSLAPLLLLDMTMAPDHAHSTAPLPTLHTHPSIAAWVHSLRDRGGAVLLVSADGAPLDPMPASHPALHIVDTAIDRRRTAPPVHRRHTTFNSRSHHSG